MQQLVIQSVNVQINSFRYGLIKMKQLLLSLVTSETANGTETAAVGILLSTEWNNPSVLH